MSIQSTDQIADLITRIRNACLVGKNEISVPTSKLKVAILDVLVRTGFISAYRVETSAPRDLLIVTIAGEGELPRLNEIEKVSKPGRRVYAAADEMPKVKSGRGIILVSTSKGIMTGAEAVKARLGGEVLVKVW